MNDQPMFDVISGMFGLISGMFALISGMLGLNMSSIDKVFATRTTLLSWFFISCYGIDSTVVV